MYVGDGVSECVWLGDDDGLTRIDWVCCKNLCFFVPEKSSTESLSVLKGIGLN